MSPEMCQSIHVVLCTGACESAFRNIKSIAECLVDELINVAKESGAFQLNAHLHQLSVNSL